MKLFGKKKQKVNQQINLELEARKQEQKEELKKLANPQCNKCYGEGYIGWDSAHKYWLPCKCAIKSAQMLRNVYQNKTKGENKNERQN